MALTNRPETSSVESQNENSGSVQQSLQSLKNITKKLNLMNNDSEYFGSREEKNSFLEMKEQADNIRNAIEWENQEITETVKALQSELAGILDTKFEGSSKRFLNTISLESAKDILRSMGYAVDDAGFSLDTAFDNNNLGLRTMKAQYIANILNPNLTIRVDGIIGTVFENDVVPVLQEIQQPANADIDSIYDALVRAEGDTEKVDSIIAKVQKGEVLEPSHINEELDGSNEEEVWPKIGNEWEMVMEDDGVRYVNPDENGDGTITEEELEKFMGETETSEEVVVEDDVEEIPEIDIDPKEADQPFVVREIEQSPVDEMYAEQMMQNIRENGEVTTDFIYSNGLDHYADGRYTFAIEKGMKWDVLTRTSDGNIDRFDGKKWVGVNNMERTIPTDKDDSFAVAQLLENSENADQLNEPTFLASMGADSFDTEKYTYAFTGKWEQKTILRKMAWSDTVDIFNQKTGKWEQPKSPEEKDFENFLTKLDVSPDLKSRVDFKEVMKEVYKGKTMITDLDLSDPDKKAIETTLASLQNSKKIPFDLHLVWLKYIASMSKNLLASFLPSSPAKEKAAVVQSKSQPKIEPKTPKVDSEKTEKVSIFDTAGKTEFIDGYMQAGKEGVYSFITTPEGKKEYFYQSNGGGKKRSVRPEEIRLAQAPRDKFVTIPDGKPWWEYANIGSELFAVNRLGKIYAFDGDSWTKEPIVTKSLFSSWKNVLVKVRQYNSARSSDTIAQAD